MQLLNNENISYSNSSPQVRSTIFVDYRISADYGSVVLMKSNNSESVDMIGSPVNMCSKIDHAATKWCSNIWRLAFNGKRILTWF